jgi:hypothetical protein
MAIAKSYNIDFDIGDRPPPLGVLRWHPDIITWANKHSTIIHCIMTGLTFNQIELLFDSEDTELLFELTWL